MFDGLFPKGVEPQLTVLVLEGFAPIFMKHQLNSFQTVITQSYHLPYQLYLPADYGLDGSRTWPLILSLHGASTRGDDPSEILKGDLPSVLEEGVEYPFIVVSPLCPRETWWSDHLSAIDVLLKDVCDRYTVDLNRISVTGVSMGAYGVWHLGAEYPDRFSALVPISGGAAWFYGFPQRVRRIHDMSVWVFHGDADPIIPLREAVALVDEIKAGGGKPKLTIIPAGGHDIWKQVYRMPDLISWLLEQKR